VRDIVVIGGSAGSIGALRTIVRDLPADFPAAILIVVHISADFPSPLDTLLSSWGYLPASQAARQCGSAGLYAVKKRVGLAMVQGSATGDTAARVGRSAAAITGAATAGRKAGQPQAHLSAVRRGEAVAAAQTWAEAQPGAPTVAGGGGR